MSENTRVVSRIKHIWEVIMCPYEDKSLAFWIKVVFGFIWAISIPNGIVYGYNIINYNGHSSFY